MTLGDTSESTAVGWGYEATHSARVGLCLQWGGGGKTVFLGFHYEGAGCCYGDCIQPKTARWQKQTVSRATSANATLRHRLNITHLPITSIILCALPKINK